MYSSDYDQRIPCGRPQYRACANGSTAFYQHVIYPYVKNSPIFQCPSNTYVRTTCGRFFPWANTMVTSLKLHVNYGINCRYGTSGGYAEANIVRPAESIYLVDGLNAGGGWWRGLEAAHRGCAKHAYYRELH